VRTLAVVVLDKGVRDALEVARAVDIRQVMTSCYPCELVAQKEEGETRRP
jgi:hypothetical protein